MPSFEKMPILLNLPEELLCKISGFVHPQNVIDWACACNKLSRCSSQALKVHRQRQTELRVIHDRNPITIPSLLRKSLSEPDILWYPQSLDVWDLRENYGEWKSPTFHHFPDWSEESHDYSHLDIMFYTDEELQRYRSLISNLLHLKEPLLNKWMERLHSGSDEPHKVLLMAMSPKLNKAKFVEYLSEGRGHPFRMLGSALRALAPFPSPQWPCFQNLKTVVVGQYTELRHPHDAFYPHSRVIAPLFLLPAIEELHLHLLMGEGNDPDSDLENDEEDGGDSEPYVWEWETGRSSCQKLTCKPPFSLAQRVKLGANFEPRKSIAASWPRKQSPASLAQRTLCALSTGSPGMTKPCRPSYSIQNTVLKL